MIGRNASRRGFSITEVLVVIGVIALLLGMLFPALTAFRKSGLMTKSMSNMRQISTWMTMYSSDNRDFIVPSQFNYADNGYPGKVRSEILLEPKIGDYNRGTWADILWTVFEVGKFPEAAGPRPDGLGHSYQFDSPDGVLYDWLEKNVGYDINNPLRSAAENSQYSYKSPHNLATPFGPGASETGLAGYFAANNFFNADPVATDIRTGNPAPDASWYTTAQIRAPEKSMYLVDSYAGEIIQPWEDRFRVWDALSNKLNTNFHVDFRYSDLCLMLFLDGHLETQNPWETIQDLEGDVGQGINGRGIRIRDLDRRAPPSS